MVRLEKWACNLLSFDWWNIHLLLTQRHKLTKHFLKSSLGGRHRWSFISNIFFILFVLFITITMALGRNLIEIILQQIKNGHNFLLTLASTPANIAKQRVKNSFTMFSSTDAIINNEPKYSKLIWISVLDIEINANNFGHGSRTFLTVPPNSVIEVAAIAALMLQFATFADILLMISRHLAQGIMSLKCMDRFLLE